LKLSTYINTYSLFRSKFYLCGCTQCGVNQLWGTRWSTRNWVFFFLGAVPQRAKEIVAIDFKNASIRKRKRKDSLSSVVGTFSLYSTRHSLDTLLALQSLWKEPTGDHLEEGKKKHAHTHTHTQTRTQYTWRKFTRMSSPLYYLNMHTYARTHTHAHRLYSRTCYVPMHCIKCNATRCKNFISMYITESDYNDSQKHTHIHIHIFFHLQSHFCKQKNPASTLGCIQN